MYQNYITGQTSLTLNLDFSVPENHLINVISTFVDSIPDDVMLETRPYNLMCKDEQFLKVNQNWV